MQETIVYLSENNTGNYTTTLENSYEDIVNVAVSLPSNGKVNEKQRHFIANTDIPAHTVLYRGYFIQVYLFTYVVIFRKTHYDSYKS